MPEIFAATPPLEALRILVSQAAPEKSSSRGIVVVNIRRADFYAQSVQQAFVDIPQRIWQKTVV